MLVALLCAIICCLYLLCFSATCTIVTVIVLLVYLKSQVWIATTFHQSQQPSLAAPVVYYSFCCHVARTGMMHSPRRNRQISWSTVPSGHWTFEKVGGCWHCNCNVNSAHQLQDPAYKTQNPKVQPEIVSVNPLPNDPPKKEKRKLGFVLAMQTLKRAPPLDHLPLLLSFPIPFLVVCSRPSQDGLPHSRIRCQTKATQRLCLVDCFKA